MHIGIVGGGITGITLGYYLSRQGCQVDIYEASPTIGGLAGSLQLADGALIDRYYHVILSHDMQVMGLCKDLGIEDKLRFRETKMGFYHSGKIHSMNNVVEFLRFPPLNWIDRFRLGLTVLYAQFVKDWKDLEGIGVEEWLVRISGRNTYQNIWRPLLKAKFDGGFENTPATYMWARLVRMKSTRGGVSQKEMAGHLVGGFMTMVTAMAAYIEKCGGRIYTKTPVQEVVIENEQAKGIRLTDEVREFDKVVVTLQTPFFKRLVPKAPQTYLDYLAKTDYIGIICPVMVLDRPLSGYWTLNITDDRVPFTGVIETTTYIDPQYVGGHHLVYLPKYTAPGSEWQKKTDEEIRAIWMENLHTMFPQFDEKWVKYFLIHRERFVEPIHGLNGTDLIPAVKTPVDRLYLATTAQIYPALPNSESVTRHAEESANIVFST
jgi:protoporphyrinogen oxidase